MSATAMPSDRQIIAADELPAAAPDSIAIICGGGSFPAAVADAITRSGGRPVMFAINGWADPASVERYAHHWVALGQVGRFLRLAEAERCRQALFIGTLLRPAIRQIRFDWQALKMMPRIVAAYAGGDNRLLSGMARLIEESGLRIIGVKDVAPEIIVPEGALGRYEPSARDRTDIARALDLIATLGRFDAGQAVVIAANHVLAVEAAEGTDHLLARIAELRAKGRVTTPPGVGVLVKAPKPAQDRRFDLPAIGPQTVAKVAAAGLAGIAVAAGDTMIADAAEVIAAADRAGIFVVGVDAAKGSGRQ
jgi:UDP-2,3-diacylglucosamine hydrolase